MTSQYLRYTRLGAGEESDRNGKGSSATGSVRSALGAEIKDSLVDFDSGAGYTAGDTRSRISSTSDEEGFSEATASIGSSSKVWRGD